MPFDHTTNTANACKVKKVALGATEFDGRTSGLPIYSVNLSALKPVMGDILGTVISSIKRDDEKDMIQGYRQPTNHEDRDGNLPAAPGNGVVYREYNVPGNTLPKAAYVRLVADLHNGRMFITPTHYDTWLISRDSASAKDADTAVGTGENGAQNPFFLIKVQA